MNITQKLVEEVISFTYTSLSPETVTITKLALMDNLGTTLFGYQQVDKPLVGYAKATGGTPQATVIGGGHKVSNGLTAAVNAQMSTDSDLDEIGPGVHVFAPLAATALAIGEFTGATML